MSEPTDTTGAFARSAGIIALGNMASRALGFVRDGVIAALFGSGAHVDALTLALTLPTQIYELVTGGLVNSALVPVFGDYAKRDRANLWRLVSVVLTAAVVLVSGLMAGLAVFTPQVVGVMGGGHNPAAQAQAADLLRLTLPAVVLLSVAGVLSGVLYALKRFTYPAFTAAVFNAGMVITSLVLAPWLDVAATALGLLVGAAFQVVLQAWGLRDARLRVHFDVFHPGLRQILRLYVPIIGGLVITQASIYFGLSLAWEFTGGLGWMRYATTLYQFPLGLVAVAVSSAILPTLAQQTGPEFRATLVRGLNLVVLLIVPATVGLWVLAEPVVALAFERGQFTPADTAMTAQVLRVFLIGLPFAAVDLVLIVGFYAGQNTLTPSLVGVLSVAVYITVALVTRPLAGLFSLMLADAAKQLVHALVTGGLLARRVGGFGGTGLGPTMFKVLIAAALMGVAVQGTLWLVSALPLSAGLVRHAVLALAPGTVGVLVYFGLAFALRLEELAFVQRLARKLVRR